MLAVLTVDTDLDIVDAADGLTSLREAVVIANNLAGADEIVFDFDHEGPALIKLEHGELQLTDAVSIVGGGPELLTIDAQQQSRIFNITADYGDFTIESLTLTSGKTTGEEEFGGAIRFWRGALTIQNSVVKDSFATGSGGGIGGGVYSEEGDWLTVNSSTIFGNSAATGGGGIAIFGGVTINSSTIAENSVTEWNGSGGGISAYHASVNSSTISGNWATGSGGGIEAGSVSVNSSTISGNSATGRGGGISAYSVGVSSSTISGNWASSGGGISGAQFYCGGCAITASLNNSIVAGNKDHGTHPDLAIGISTIQYSLVGDYQGTGLPEAPVGSPDANGNLIGGPSGGIIDPRLGPLADNGGPTFTHALLSGSPAIDAGDSRAVAGSDNVPLHDQRGEPRATTVDGNADGVSLIDMGAVERQSKSLTATIVSVSSPIVTAVDAVTIQFTSAVSGFDVGDLRLSLNGGKNLLTGDETLASADNQTFVLSGMADATAVAGYYTMSVIPSGSDIMALDGGQLDSEVSTSWAMDRAMLGLTVNTLADEADGRIDDGDVSLRDAIAAAVPGETINFDVSLDGGTILLTLGELRITRSLTVDATELAVGLVIDAAGNDVTPTAADGRGSRIFDIDDENPYDDSPVTIRGMTLTGGDVHAEGGAIRSQETLSIESASISRNSAGSEGGGIWAVGDVTIASSMIARNGGGGIRAFGNVTVTSSTISENDSARDGGGGIWASNVTVSSSTIFGNSGQGIFASQNAIIESSIVAGNIDIDANRGYRTIPGGVFILTGTDLSSGNRTLTVQHSLIGDNRGTDLQEAPVGSPDTNGNLIGGPVGGVIDPRLGPLADNGGPTFTHALLPASPVIDAGDPVAVAGGDGVPFHDQRGEPYAVMVDGNDDGVARIDMGALERQSESLTATIVSISSPTATPVDVVTIQFTSAVSGFDVGDLKLSLNGNEQLLSGAETLRSADSQTFVLSGMADATSSSGYYTLTLTVFGSEIMASDGGPLDAAARISWAMGRSTLGLTVDTLVDEADGRINDGDVSLRDAIAAAAPGETINFDTSLDGGTILLTQGELSITQSLTVDATELVTGLIIDAAGNDPTPNEDDGRGSRIFEIDDGNPFADSPVSIRGLTLTGADTHAVGGAIFSRETLSVESASIVENSAGSDGGGIWSVADVTISSSTISENSAAGGNRREEGSVTALGNVTVNSSTVSDNSGRGIYTLRDVTVNSSTISGNSGGGIQGGNVTVSSATISDNSAISEGGGISADNVTVSSSTILGNSGMRGGGINAYYSVTVTSSIIADNNATDEGGGIHSRNGVVTVSSSTISGNSSEISSGGGIRAETVMVEFSTISGNSAPRDGGGISADDVTVSSSTISGNNALHGGGFSGDDVAVYSSTISGNTAVFSGGGISGNNVAVHSSTISGNATVYRGEKLVGYSRLSVGGGGINSREELKIADSILAGNHGTTPDLKLGSSSTNPTVQYSVIGDNRGSGLPEAKVGSPDANGNLIGGPMNGVIDPGLGPLADNGGSAFTHALLSGSPAIDAGDPFAAAGSDGVPHDQRGERYAIVVDGNDDGVARIDIGALERQNLTATMLSVLSPTVTPVDEVTIQFTSTVSGLDIGDIKLSLNGGENLLAGGETLSSVDNQTFVLSGMADATSSSGYYTLTVTAGSEITASGGGPLDSGTSMSWAMGRSMLGGLTVDTLVDEADGRIDDGDVSLRDAIAAAAPGETIGFDASLDGGTILLTLGELSITRPLTIDATKLATGLVVDAAGNDSNQAANDGRGSRIFDIAYGAPFADSPVAIRGMTLTGGDAYSEGGAIRSQENLSIESVSIIGNSSNTAGGGIWTAGDVTISSSTIAENSVPGRWGSSGGVSAFGNVTVDSSTISGNSAPRNGGGITGNDVTVRSSTISMNTGQGIMASGNVTILNSILAGNKENDDTDGRTDLSRGTSPGTLTIQHSLIGDNRGTDMAEAPVGSPDANGNLLGGRRGGIIDPLLGPLADNGGRTRTHALLPGSPAINMGDPSMVARMEDAPLFDQRGTPYRRVVHGRVDMGAFERGIAGDTNGDGNVDFADFLILSAHFGTGQSWREGNFDGSEDGTQFADFVVLANNFGFEELISDDVPKARREPASPSTSLFDQNVDEDSPRNSAVDHLLAQKPNEVIHTDASWEVLFLQELHLPLQTAVDGNLRR